MIAETVGAIEAIAEGLDGKGNMWPDLVINDSDVSNCANRTV